MKAGHVLLIFALCFKAFVVCDRPKGTSLDHAPLYARNGKSHFQCLDGSLSVPFEWVNDDYCDCSDGSDEPGTAACSNGQFHCVNSGHKSINIPSWKVNDRICDCCDGSDEWQGLVTCTNYCVEAGRAAREAAQRIYALHTEGLKKKVDMVKDGQDTRIQNQKKLDQLKIDQANIAPRLQELEASKQNAEQLEKEAKDKHINRWNAEQDEKKKNMNQQDAQASSDTLDENNGQQLIDDKHKMDLNHDKNQDDVAETTDQEKSPTSTALPPAISPPQSEDEDVPSFAEESKPSPIDEDEPEDEVKEDENEDKEDENVDETKRQELYEKYKQLSVSSPASRPEDEMPDFDNETKLLIAAADQARTAHGEVERKNQEIQDELKSMEEFLKIDFGPDAEFSSLHRRCFEYSDHQYIYGLCLFDRTFQKPKDGGHGEVSLGSWDSWSGAENDRYSEQYYKNGMTCWNGPARSTKIKLRCAAENKLVSASEPARCEYLMEFQTPGACKQQPDLSSLDIHSEL